MESAGSNPQPLPDDSQNNEHSIRLAQNIEGFQKYMDKIFEAIEQDEKFSKMTAESYMRSHLLELASIHTSLADQYAALIKEVSKHCPSLLQKQHPESSDSTAPPQGSSMSSVTKSPIPLFNALKLVERKDSGSISSISSVNKHAVSPWSDDSLKVEETNDYGSDSSMLYVNKPLVPPVIDDALKVEETKCSKLISEVNTNINLAKAMLKSLKSKDAQLLSLPEAMETVQNVVYKELLEMERTMKMEVVERKDSGSDISGSSVNKGAVSPCGDDTLKVEETKDYGSDSSMLYVKKPAVPPVIDDALKVKEIKASDLEDLMPLISHMNTGMALMKTALKLRKSEDLDPLFSLVETIQKAINDMNLVVLEPEREMKMQAVETKDYGSDSSMLYVNKPQVAPVIDDALKVEEIKGSDLEDFIPLLSERNEMNSIKTEFKLLKTELKLLELTNVELHLLVELREQTLNDVNLKLMVIQMGMDKRVENAGGSYV